MLTVSGLSRAGCVTGASVALRARLPGGGVGGGRFGTFRQRCIDVRERLTGLSALGICGIAMHPAFPRNRASRSCPLCWSRPRTRRQNLVRLQCARRRGKGREYGPPAMARNRPGGVGAWPGAWRSGPVLSLVKRSKNPPLGRVGVGAGAFDGLRASSRRISVDTFILGFPFERAVDTAGAARALVATSFEPRSNPNGHEWKNCRSALGFRRCILASTAVQLPFTLSQAGSLSHVGGR